VKDSEWFGEPHTLIVHEVRPPNGQSDPGELLEYDLEHAPSCKEELVDYWGLELLEWTCDVAHHERDCGLADALTYSGTPITAPGTYRIQSWGRKTYYYWAGYEYDGGVGLMEPEVAA
jgi:hypothetical protein